jgi:pimeloyl-ACP methyl ester carboxylesterase
MGCLALAEPLVSAAPHASVSPARPARRLASAAPDVEALPDTGDVPAIVLSSTQPSTGDTHAFRTLAAQLQKEIATAYVARRHDFVIGSGHYIQRDQPQQVINAARELGGCNTGK